VRKWVGPLGFVDRRRGDKENIVRSRARKKSSWVVGGSEGDSATCHECLTLMEGEVEG